MLPKEAIDKITDANPGFKITSMYDYGEFYVAYIRPYSMGDNEQYSTGVTFPAVDKKTGKVYDYRITSDLVKFDNAEKLF